MARNKYPEETKNLIIDTAMKLFIEQGYDHTSIQDIINHLGGLSKGAIYHHFKSKEDIMSAVADKMYAGFDSEMESIFSRKDLNGLGKLKEMFRKSAFNPVQKEMFVVAPDLLKNSQLLVLYLKNTVQKEANGIVYRGVQEGIEDGSIQTEYPKELAEVMMVLGDIWLNPMIYHAEPEEMTNKVKFYQQILKLLGVDIIEDEMIEKLEEYASLYKQNAKR